VPPNELLLEGTKDLRDETLPPEMAVARLTKFAVRTLGLDTGDVKGITVGSPMSFLLSVDLTPFFLFFRLRGLSLWRCNRGVTEASLRRVFLLFTSNIIAGTTTVAPSITPAEMYNWVIRSI
jgi:hypothetical protein